MARAASPLRPVAIPGARRALVGRRHDRRQPDARRHRSVAGAQPLHPVATAASSLLRRRRRRNHRGFRRTDRRRHLARRPVERHRPRRISAAISRPLRFHRRRPAPESAKARRSADRSTGFVAGGRRRRNPRLQYPAELGPPPAASSWTGSTSSSCARRSRAPSPRPRPIGMPFAITATPAHAASSTLCRSISRRPAACSKPLFLGVALRRRPLRRGHISGWSNLLGADLRSTWPVRSTLAAPSPAPGVGGGSFAYSGGPSVGVTPFENGRLLVGWNIVGFHDRDFKESRYTNSGPYLTMRFKFDQTSLQELGLGQGRQ